MKASELLRESADPFDKACMIVIDLEKQRDEAILALSRYQDALTGLVPCDINDAKDRFINELQVIYQKFP